jgi:hypothetical protein
LSPGDFVDQKWAIIITFPRDNEYAVQTLRGIIGAKLQTIPLTPPNPNDLDAPKLVMTDAPGIILHGNNQLNERLLLELQQCFNIKKTGNSPTNLQDWYNGKVPADYLVDWIDIGPGSPWNPQANPSCSE